ncbi:MAG TPA: HAD hydrolase family protein [Pyrinomonadaceae bacterium]|nr:HAD hydrolase family protein [Acidobacteriota bacterium]HQZ98148.1 HAD hydrolase family protein [Pyrinomonadaceae bacterium]
MAINLTESELVGKAKRISLIIMDCDGVLTDGRLFYAASGEELKVFSVRDGQGIVDWHKAGNRSGIISGRNSPIVELRAKELGIEFVYQGRKEKVSALNELILAAGVLREEVAFIGDDTPDSEVFAFVGLAVAVADAHETVKAAAHFTTRQNGGHGAVREVIDLILASKNT